MYKIIVEYYRTKQDLEGNLPYRVADSGFDKLTLEEAYICKSKMSEEPVLGMIRVNKVVYSGAPAAEQN